MPNYCQNLWMEFGRLQQAQAACGRVLADAVSSGGDLAAARLSIDGLVNSLISMKNEWENSYGTLPDGRRLFGPEIEAVLAIAEAAVKGQPSWNLKALLHKFSIEDDHVTEFNISGLIIPDLSQLLRLTFTRDLLLENCHIENGVLDVSALQNLERLDVSRCSVSEIRGLDKITNLKLFYLTRNDIASIPDLSSLSKLEQFILQCSNVKSLDFIKNNTSLKLLKLIQNPITDLSPIANLRQLTFLELFDLPIASIDSIAGLKDLTTLHFNGDSITDIGPVAGLNNLRALFITGGKTTDFSPLANLAELKNLTIKNNRHFTDIGHLRGMNELQELRLENTGTADLRPLLELPSLRWVGIKNIPAKADDITKQKLRDKGIVVNLLS